MEVATTDLEPGGPSCHSGSSSLSGPAWWSAVAHGAPAVLLALVPKCPLCWLTYASALGLAGIAPTAFRWALPITAALLVIALMPLVVRRSGAGLGPAALGLVAAAIALIGRGSWWAIVGAPLLVAATLWHRRDLTPKAG